MIFIREDSGSQPAHLHLHAQHTPGARSFLREDVKPDVCIGRRCWEIRRVFEIGRTELEHGEIDNHILCLGRKGSLPLPVTISINLLLQLKPAASSSEGRQRSSELPQMYHLPDCVKLCSYMIKALFSQTTIHLQVQMYGFALTHVYTCQVCV